MHRISKVGGVGWEGGRGWHISPNGTFMNRLKTDPKFSMRGLAVGRSQLKETKWCTLHEEYLDYKLFVKCKVVLIMKLFFPD